MKSLKDTIKIIEETLPVPVEQPNTNPTDVVKVDVPLLIRLLEYAREDAKTDMDLHDLTEKLIKMSSGEDRVLNMQDYDVLVKKEEDPNKPFDNLKEIEEPEHVRPIKHPDDYEVFYMWDGVPDQKPLGSGSKEACLRWMKQNWSRYAKGKGELALAKDGQLISFMLDETYDESLNESAGFMLFSQALSNLVTDGKITIAQALFIYVGAVFVPLGLIGAGLTDSQTVRRLIRNIYRNWKETRTLDEKTVQQVAQEAEEAYKTMRPGQKAFLRTLMNKVGKDALVDKKRTVQLHREIKDYIAKVDKEKKDAEERRAAAQSRLSSAQLTKTKKTKKVRETEEEMDPEPACMFKDGDKVQLKPEYADRDPYEIFRVTQCEPERRRCWIADKQGRGWSVNFGQIQKAKRRPSPRW